jgi:histone H3/H4
MKTGQGETSGESFEQSATDLLLPVLESATVLAAHYAKACGRDTILAEDMSYGLMFAARNVLGKHTGSLYPEAYDDSESDSISETSDEDPEWTRYSGADETALKMNECADTWDQWVPENPAERALKNAVDKNSVFGRG